MPEIVIVEPEARTAEVWKLAAGGCERISANADGTLVSDRLEVSFRTQPGDPPRLELSDNRGQSRRMSL